MKNLIASILFAVFSVGAFAGPIDQGIATRWVMKHSNVDKQTASAIVSNAYKQAANVGLDPTLILGIMRAESGFRHTVKSGYGAIGLMQVVPRWHKEKIRGRSLKDIRVNTEVGSKILMDCMEAKKFNTTKALSCYSGYPPDEVHNYKRRVYSYRNELLMSIMKGEV